LDRANCIDQYFLRSLSISAWKKTRRKALIRAVVKRSVNSELLHAAVIIAADAVTPATIAVVVVVVVVIVERTRRTRVFIENNYQHVPMCEGYIRMTFILVWSLGARAWVHANVRREWREEDRMCICICEEKRQNVSGGWKSAGSCKTRRRRRNKRTEMEEEEVNVYRRHCGRIEIDGSTATRPSRKTCMFRLFSAQHPRLRCVCVCCACRATNVQTWNGATYHTCVSSLMTEGTKEKSFYFRFWPICNHQGFFDVSSRLSNLYDLILLLYFMNICDSFCCGITTGVSRKLQMPIERRLSIFRVKSLLYRM